jgi:general secretion pathway protein K
MKTGPDRSERGAVLLLALLAVALIVSLLGSVQWRQSSLIRIESAERQRQQALWLLRGAMDWGRLILREDARSGSADHLSEPWAVPLQESRLSSFLAAQSATTQALTTLDEDVFLSGGIEDAQGRFNLTNLLQGSQIDPIAQAQLARLLALMGLPANLSEDLAEKMAQSSLPGGRWLPARTLDDLLAWGWQPAHIERLRAHVTILPERTPINVNTASPEVLSATVEGLSLAGAERLAQSRARSPWTQTAQAQLAFSGKLDAQLHGISSQFFVLSARLRLGQTEVTQTGLVQRDGQAVVYRWVIPLSTVTRP